MTAFSGSKDKEISSKPMEMIKGGGASSSTGPTGSSRSYPKGGSKPGDSQDAPFNPQKVAATDIYVGGVG